MEVECEVLVSVPVLTGCQGQCEGRHRAGSPLECQRRGRQRSQGHTGHRAHPVCYAGSSGRRSISVLKDLSIESGWL